MLAVGVSTYGEREGVKNMKRFQRTILLSFLLLAGVAHADSIPTFKITDAFLQIEPGGENHGFVGFNFAGPGINIFGEGFYECNVWCNFFTFVTDGFPIDIQNMTAESLTVQIGGQTYNENEAVLGPWNVNPSTDFFVPGGSVTALLNNGLILGSVGTGNNVLQFYLNVPPGQLSLFFPQSDIDPSLFTFVGGGSFIATTTVPEPGTLALLATGCIVGLFLKRCDFART